MKSRRVGRKPAAVRAAADALGVEVEFSRWPDGVWSATAYAPRGRLFRGNRASRWSGESIDGKADLWGELADLLTDGIVRPSREDDLADVWWSAD